MKIILLFGALALCLNLIGQAPGSGVIDIDGNSYETVIIGTQEWMAENLSVETYSNGDPIPNVTDNNAWADLYTGAWAYYDNTITYNDPFGKLYNGFTVVDSRGLCPSGWSVPTLAEWDTLSVFLGGNALAGGELKESTTFYWIAPNFGATNNSNFSALPGGSRGGDGVFGPISFIGNYGHYATSTEPDLFGIWTKYLWRGDAYLYSAGGPGGSKKGGTSVRCIRNGIAGNTEIELNERTLIKIVDLMGRETEYQPNTVLIYVFDDGSTEKVFKMED